MTLEEIKKNAPEGATHYYSGNFYRLERNNKVRAFHVCGGECYAYRGENGCSDNNKWERYTCGEISDKMIPLP